MCLEKTPGDFEVSLVSLMAKAIKAYESRGAGMRHGIALDNQVTIILSQGDDERPLCGIYFNLHSPYQKNALPKTVKAFAEKSHKKGRLNSSEGRVIRVLKFQKSEARSQNGGSQNSPLRYNY